jgi:hypothetical protein
MINPRLLLVMISTAFAVGCATPASQQMMSVTSPTISGPKVDPRLKGTVHVRNVSGGQDTNPLWVSQVGTNEFRGALLDSLKAYGYSAADPKDAKMFLDANLQSLSQPFAGFTFNVVSVVNYTVEAKDSSTPSTRIPITATGTATVSDAFLGTERMRLANERSIKENIAKFLNALGALP